MKAILRADASAAIGAGHVSRCLTLANALTACGFAVEVVTRRPSDHTRSWIAREGHALRALEDRDLEETLRAADGASLIVIDGYDFGLDYERALARPDRVVCTIDDLGARAFAASVIVNANLYGSDVPYDAGTSELVTGPSFALVRDEFRKARLARVNRVATSGRPRLLVTMGGADPTMETEKVLAALSRLPPLHVRVAVGGANPRLAQIRQAANAISKHEVEVLADARMGELMVWCDLALTAAGSTTLELACVGVPSIAIQTADNQSRSAAELTKRQLMDVIGRHDTVSPPTVASAVERLLEDSDRQRAQETAQRGTVDGLGKERVAARLLELCKELR